MISNKLILLAIFFASVCSNVYLYKKNTEIKLQLNMVKHAKNLKPIGNRSAEEISLKYGALKDKFTTNAYNLRNNAPETPKINVKSICDADNGVRCAYFENNKIKFYGKNNVI